MFGLETQEFFFDKNTQMMNSTSEGQTIVDTAGVSLQSSLVILTSSEHPLSTSESFTSNSLYLRPLEEFPQGTGREWHLGVLILTLPYFPVCQEPVDDWSRRTEAYFF